jgi:hypothetical protein
VREESAYAISGDYRYAIDEPLQSQTIGPASGEGNDLKVIVDQ